MNRPKRSLGVAYALMMLGPTGVARMYLGFWLSGVLMFAGVMGGIAVLGQGLASGVPARIVLFSLPLAAIVTWWLLDFISIPSMVARANGDVERDKAFVSAAAVNMDPAFSATLNRAGATQDREQGSALPDDYVRPWQKTPEPQQIIRYRPKE